MPRSAESRKLRFEKPSPPAGYPAFPVRSGIANSCIVKSYLGLLCLGKNDFDAIESFRGNAFFMRALRLQAVPPDPTLRQRLDT